MDQLNRHLHVLVQPKTNGNNVADLDFAALVIVSKTLQLKDNSQINDFQKTWITSVLIPWLGIDAEKSKTTYRIAPSILCRSEVELLGASFPRFALRADFGPLGFANFRRLPKLQQAIGHYSEAATLPEDVVSLLMVERDGRLPDLRKDFEQSIKKSPSMADALLVPSPQLEDAFEIIGVKLWNAYGEEERPRKGTPFVQHIRFGGGLCAQAVSFMACCLLERWAKEIGGIPSVTNAVRKRITGRDDLVVFDGLGIEDLSVFFRQIKLYAPRETNGLCAFSNRLGISDRQVTSVILRSYITSGMPVIFATTVSKMTRIYETIQRDSRSAIRQYGSGLIKEKAPGSFQENAHTVLLVGIEKANGQSDVERVLIQDPRALPFMIAGIEELCEAKLDSREFISLPVTPADVQLRLGATTDQGSKSKPGLLDVLICANLGDAVVDQHLKRIRDAVDRSQSFGDWRLLGRSTLEDQELLNALADQYNLSQKATTQLMKLCQAFSSWRWVHFIKEPNNGATIFTLWDATQEPPESLSLLKSVEKYVLNFGMCSGQAVVIGRQVKDKAEPVTHSIPAPHVFGSPRSEFRPQLSLVSSFSPYTSRIMFRSWPTNVQVCELYAFMNCEKFIRKSNEADAAVKMAELSRDDKFIADFGHSLCSMGNVRRSAPGQPQIRALATYFPFLALDPRNARAKTGTSALTFTLKLASVVQRIQGSHEHVFPVEVVSGTRVRGLYPYQLQRRNSGEPLEPLFVHVSSSEAAIRNLVDNLRKAYQDAKLPPTSNISIAVELEPHSLGTITNFPEVSQFVQELDDRRDHACDRIGLNVDIAHWRIAGIGPDNARQPAILRRIAHAHISGHHATGHFGDVPLMAFDRPEVYYPWLSLLEDVTSAPENKLYSGMISVECEVVAPNLVTKCIEDTLAVLSSWQDRRSRSWQNG